MNTMTCKRKFADRERKRQKTDGPREKCPGSNDRNHTRARTHKMTLMTVKSLPVFVETKQND